MKQLLWGFVCCLLATGMSTRAATGAESIFPRVMARDLPEPLQESWHKQKPEPGGLGSCAAAFDSHANQEKMAFSCSIYIRMAAEGERRAMMRCNELRSHKDIAAACKIIRD